MAKAWHLVRRPQGMPVMEDFAFRDLPRRELADGEVRIANRWLSVDPYMRGRMNDVKSYVPPFQLDAPMDGGAVGEVIESRAADLPVGTRVQHMAGWRDEAIVPAKGVNKIPDIDVPEQAFLGALGLTGMTAWFGLLTVAEAKPGDTVFVSAAAGAVGSVVVQIAKVKGMTVIGSAGGAEKVEWVRSLGADQVIDYKGDVPLAKALGAAAPNGIDVYFDNVGGDHLDAALAHANQNARFAICGMIDGYNASQPTSLRYLMRVIAARIRIQGFIVSDYLGKIAEFQQGMGEIVASGNFQREETIVEGLENTLDAFLGLFSGQNRGKMLVKL
ncbi:NADP-dependent oxidoreductase [Sphingomonas panni]|uniref:NADP-dependent oxidoreductase n=1 Tax=Sphingomonas panni TaxID=237612 RepID=UPI001F5B6738|nr:NADP-dependent oxidoreductase [Sphingomonas panni]